MVFVRSQAAGHNSTAISTKLHTQLGTRQRKEEIKVLEVIGFLIRIQYLFEGFFNVVR